jgi:catechol 2,3-dioxygenase-like lactoylglutathione lyase family enzyme
MSVRQLRLVVAAEDYEAAIAFYRDGLGLREQEAIAGPGGAHVTILDAGRATLELANPAQRAYIDEVEVGRPVAPRLRVAFEVDDVRTAGTAGAVEVAPPTVTPWNSLNTRLDAPAGLQITLFQELSTSDSPPADLDVAGAFAVFDEQDSGCRSYGVERDGRRWFVKKAVRPEARASLTRAAALHAAVRHPAIVRPAAVLDGTDGPTLVYPWCAGSVLNAATVHGSDRSALDRFRRLPVESVERALDAILDAHRAVAAAGWVAVDLYDGCFLYDFDAKRMWLIDLDEYRPGPFTLDSERLPGSRSYLAPEEFVRGSAIDERTMVHALGRTLHHLLDSAAGWRGTDRQRAVVARATDAAPSRRHPTVDALAADWRG